jgi:hypothetical protein
MLKQQFLRRAAVLFVIAMVVPLIAACGSQAAQQPIKETVVVKETSAPVKETVVVEKEVVTDASFTTPGPPKPSTKFLAERGVESVACRGRGEFCS